MSSSSSSENTPLLNGSHEGPCYAYTQSREEEEDGGEREADSPDSTLLNEKHPFLSFTKTIFFLLLFIFCSVSLSFVGVTNAEWNSSGERNPIHSRETEGPLVAASIFLARLLPDGANEKLFRGWSVFWDPSDEESISEHLTDCEVLQNKSCQVCVPLRIVKSKVSSKKVLLAVGMLIVFHSTILLKILPQALATMVTVITSISILTLVDKRPSLQEVVTWINVETLSLVFGILFVTSILCDTGVFELIAVTTYKWSGGQTWILLTSLFLVSASLSALLAPLTTLIPMTALTIRMCEAMNVDPKQILVALVIFSNAGNTLGYSTFKHYQTKQQLQYSQFFLHVLPAALLTISTAYGLFRLKYKDASSLRFKKSLEVEEVKRELAAWKRAHNSISNYSREEESVKTILERKMAALETLLRRKLYDSKIGDYKTALTELTNTMKKKNKHVLYKTCSVTAALLLLLLMKNVPSLHVSPGWSAILGALCLLTLSDIVEFNRIEWSALLYLTSYNIFTGTLVKLDLVSHLVHEAQHFTTDDSLLTSLIFIVWVSALSSSAAVCLPFSAAMMQLINERFDGCSSIVLALSLGAGTGVNGNLLGGSSNILVSGIAEQHGFRFSYWDFFKIGFPIMVLSTTLSMVYLLICHVWFQWNIC